MKKQLAWFVALTMTLNCFGAVPVMAEEPAEEGLEEIVQEIPEENPEETGLDTVADSSEEISPELEEEVPAPEAETVGENLSLDDADEEELAKAYSGDISGRSGSVSWSLSDDGVMTLSGSGEMKSYSYASDYPWHDYRADIKSLVVGEGVTYLGNYAFQNCTNLTSVSFPSSLKRINDYVFDGCSSLTDVTLPANLTYLGIYAFSRCAALTSIEIPGGVTYIKNCAFSGCTSLTSVTIDSGVKDIHSSAFSDCTSLTSVSIPNTVGLIYEYAFSGCTSLESITIPDSVTTFGEAMFRRCTGLKSVVLPAGITDIPESTFYGCTSLTNYTIPDHIKTVGEYAFYESGLTSITIPEGVTTLGPNSFGSIKSLHSVEFPSTLTTLGQYCFAYSGLTSVTVPGTVTNLEKNAFFYCKSLVSATLEEGSTTIPIACFAQDTALKNVTLPNSLRMVGDTAFVNCSAMESFTFPEGVTTIGTNEFRSCTGLKAIYLPASLVSLDSTALKGAVNAAFFYAGPACMVENLFGDYASRVVTNRDHDYDDGKIGDGEITYTCSSCEKSYSLSFTKDGGKVTVTKITGDCPANLELPAEIDGGTVTSIGKSAFASCMNLNKVIIPEGVTSIGESAFFNCSNLTSVTIPTTVTTIEESAFHLCVSLEQAVIPDEVTKLGNYAFFSCYSLNTVTLPEGLTEFGDGAFGYCNNLENVTIPKQVTTIGSKALYGTAIKKIFISDSVTTIGEEAFQDNGIEIFCEAESAGAGWNEKWSSESDTGTPNKIYWGRSQINEYVLTFDANGGSTDATSMIVHRDAAIGELPDASRTNYNLQGWSWNEEGNSFVHAGDTYSYDSDMTVYAYWLGDAYEVELDPNGGSVYTTKLTVYYGSPYWDLPTARKTGYVNDGWTLEPNGEELITHDSIVNTLGNHKLYAHWIPRICTVYLDPMEGELDEETISVAYGTAYGKLPTPERTGYTFTGWYTVDDQKVTETTIETRDYDHYIVAHWTANTYTLTLDPNRGQVSETERTVTFDSAYGELPTPTRTGYTFTGWYMSTDVMQSEQIYADSLVKTAADHTLYASWESNKYTVTFDANGGQVIDTEMQVYYDFEYGTLPGPTRTGYTFDGWYTKADGGDAITKNSVVNIAGDHTLYAHWTANVHTLTLDANGGQVTKTEMPITYDQAYGTLPVPTRTGYTFTGWYTEGEAGQKIDGTDVVNQDEDQTVYAHWTANSYTMTLDPTGGEVTPATIQTTYDQPYGDLPDASRTGYTFLSWYSEEEEGDLVSSKTIEKIAEDHSIYAHWSANTYTVTLDPNQGDLSETELTVVYDQPYVGLSDPTRTGYTFQGWFTENGAKMTAASIVKIAADHTLKAQWKANEYTLTLEPEGGQVSDTELTITYDQPYGKLPTPTRAGYTFTGWYMLADGGDAATEATMTTATEDQTIYAHWTANTYHVTLDPNGVQTTDTEFDVIYDGPYGALNQLVRTGYTFAGWFLDGGKGAEVTQDTLVRTACDHTLTAKWNPNEYTLTLDANGGKVKNATKTVKFEQALGTLETPTRPGFDFQGWYTDPEGGDKVIAEDQLLLPEDMTIYAQWKESISAEGFVVRLYNVCLDRTPSSKEASSWTKLLNNKQQTGTQAAYGFVFSDEFKKKNLCNTDYVKALYQALMGRNADASGLKTWVGLLESGMTREEVFNGFAMSTEFNKLCKQYGIEQGSSVAIPANGTQPTGACSVCGEPDGITAFVTRLYTTCLDRKPDKSGLATWTKALRNHTASGTSVANGFFFSDEFKKKGYSNEEYVTRLYQAFFDRKPDKSGLATWVKLLNSGTTRENVFKGFADSSEFDKLCKKYGIKR